MNKDNFEHTIKFDMRAEEEDNKAHQIMLDVYKSLKEKGYNPINQLEGRKFGDSH